MKTIFIKYLSLTALLILPSCQTTFPYPSAESSRLNSEFNYVSQKGVSQNACGPASIINAFGSGSPRWQDVLSPYGQIGNQAAVLEVMKTYGGRASKVIPHRNRWNKLMGMNVIDLSTTANEMAQQVNSALPSLSHHLLPSDHPKLSSFRTKILKSIHTGFPPIVNISRHAHRHVKGIGLPKSQKIWDTLGAHSVVIVEIGEISNIENHTEKLPFSYVDPTTGAMYSGHFLAKGVSQHLPTYHIQTIAPRSNIFKSLIPKETKSYLSPSSLIGAF